MLDMLESESDAAIVRSTIDLARNLGRHLEAGVGCRPGAASGRARGELDPPQARGSGLTATADQVQTTW